MICVFLDEFRPRNSEIILKKRNPSNPNLLTARKEPIIYIYTYIYILFMYVYIYIYAGHLRRAFAVLALAMLAGASPLLRAALRATVCGLRSC